MVQYQPVQVIIRSTKRSFSPSKNSKMTFLAWSYFFEIWLVHSFILANYKRGVIQVNSKMMIAYSYIARSLRGDSYFIIRNSVLLWHVWVCQQTMKCLNYEDKSENEPKRARKARQEGRRNLKEWVCRQVWKYEIEHHRIVSHGETTIKSKTLSWQSETTSCHPAFLCVKEYRKTLVKASIALSWEHPSQAIQ